MRSLQVSIRDALTLIGGIGTMLYFDWLLTLLVLGIFALAGKPLADIGKQARKKQRESQVQIGVLNRRSGKA